MFDSLKKKFSSWFGKKEDVVDSSGAEKVVEKKRTKEKPKKEKKESKEKPAKKKIREFRKEECEAGEKSSEGVVEAKEVLKEELEEVRESEKGFFSRLKAKLTTSVLTQEQFDEIFEELEMTLLENNVALKVVEKIHDALSKELVGVSVKRSDVEQMIKDSLKKSVSDILIEGEDIFEKISKSLEPYVILFFGINGSGKTTTIAKFANMLKKKGFSCVLAAADTFRAASIEQLEEHAFNLGVPIVKSEYKADPASVVFDAIQYAQKHRLKAVLIDTAGRMYTQGNLMREMEKIARVAKPNLKIFIGESITGNDAVSQAESFDKSVGIDGIILTKADVDEKAGAILSVGFVTGKPILFLGVGQKYDDLMEFSKEKVLSGLGLD